MALDGAGARENTAIHFVEFIVRRVKHEAARNADGDADRAAIELNYKSLGHRTLLPASGRKGARERGLANRNARQTRGGVCVRFDAKRGS